MPPDATGPTPLLRGPEDLARHPNPLATDYARFRVGERLLLTGHSHQAWPDVAFEAQKRAWLDAAEAVDDKWERAFRIADRVRGEVAELLDDPGGEVALGQNTLELVARFLSGLLLRSRPRLVTTDGEFHTIRRLLDRLAEEPVEVVRIPALPPGDLAGALSRAVDDRTAAVLVSSVLFERGLVVPGLGEVQEACLLHGAELLVDAYHGVNIVPFSLRQEGLEGAYVVGGGYKYLQWGEGSCFLRVPPDSRLRPVLTGWFAEFAALEGAPDRGEVRYGRGAARFHGSTYDPTAHYRAAAVLDHFRRRELSVPLLRKVSQHQVGRLLRRVREAGIDPAILAPADDVPLEARGGFLPLRTPRAAELAATLRFRGVLVDARGSFLRLGPAPYLSDPQLDEAVELVLEAAREGGG